MRRQATTDPPDRRQEILDEAAKRFATKGVAATSVRDIAGAVGLLSGSLYHHFESKDAIVDEILTSYLDDLLVHYRAVVEAQPDPRTCLNDLIHVSLVTAEAHPYATEIYQNELNYLRSQPRFSHVLSAGGKVQRLWLGVIAKGTEQGVFRTDVDAKVFYRLIRDAVWLSVRWHRPGGAYDTDHLARDCTSIFLDGFAARPVGRRRTSRTPS